MFLSSFTQDAGEGARKWQTQKLELVDNQFDCTQAR